MGAGCSNTNIVIELKASLNDHEEVLCLCELSDERIAIGTASGLIMIYTKDLVTHKLTIKTDQFNSAVKSICQLRNGKIISASEDGKIKVWHVKDIEYFPISDSFTIEHSKAVNKVIEMSGNVFASCSDDNAIIFWDTLPPYKKKKTIIEHTGEVLSIIEARSKDMLVSMGADQKVIFWDINRSKVKKIIKDLSCHGNSLIQVRIDTYLVGGYERITVIEEFKIKTIIIKQEFELCLSLLEYKTLSKDIALLASSSGKIFVIDWFNSKPESQKDAHTKKVNSLLKIGNYVFSCSSDMLVRKWDVV